MTDTPTPKPRRWWRVAALVAAVLLVGLGVLAATFTPAWLLTPGEPFDPAASPPAPDYTQDDAWAALPSAPGHAGFAVEGTDAAPPTSPAAEKVPAEKVPAFYVHPTTSFSADHWNAAIDEPRSAELLDEVVLAAEASALRGCCDVYAPRYRQATLGTFYAEPNDAQKALALAYDDVAAAFEAFLGRIDGAPFILAGHSQGSMHLMRLLERIDGDAGLRARLVVGYLPGFALPTSWYGERYKHVGPCKTPTQTGCIAAWDTYREGATVGGTKPLWHWQGEVLVRVAPEAPRQCTNPVSWTDGGSATAEAHRGAVTPKHRGDAPGFVDLLMASGPLGIDVVGLQTHANVKVTARCEDGVLRVPDLAPLGFAVQETEPGNYHLHDYELFFVDIAENAVARAAAM